MTASASKDALRLDAAIALLQVSGLPPPAAPPGSALFLQGLIDALVELSSRDALTGLANRRSFELELARTVRPMDLVARIGGEEFAILLPNCPAAFGPQVAERIRERVARSPVTTPEGRRIAFTVSLGGAFAPQWGRSTPGVWLERADQQLYRAKREGRDRVCLESTTLAAISAAERRMLLAAAADEGLE